MSDNSGQKTCLFCKIYCKFFDYEIDEKIEDILASRIFL